MSPWSTSLLSCAANLSFLTIAMVKQGFPSVATLLLLGDNLLSFSLLHSRKTDLLNATTTAAAHKGRANLFVAGEEDAHAASPPQGTATTETPDNSLIASAVARGQDLLLQGSLQEAVNVLEDVLTYRPDEPGALLHLAEALAQLGQPRRAAALADRLLDVQQLAPEARSFILNRRGNYLASATDWVGAQASYELALQKSRHAQSINRHALRNLASLLHSQQLSSGMSGEDFSKLERAIGLYRAALGRDGSSPRPRPQSLGPEGEMHGGEIGGPVDRHTILRDLTRALLVANRAGEAIAELEYALAQKSSDSDGGGSSGIVSESEGDANDESRDGSQDAAVSTTADPSPMSKSTAFLWDSLASARLAAGDVSGAIAAGKMGLSLVGDEPGLYHNMAVTFQKAGLLKQAQDAWHAALALDPRFAPALTGLGHLEGAMGNIARARELYEASLSMLRSIGQAKGVESDGGNHGHVYSGDEELTAMFLIATAVIPALYRSNDHIAQVRRDFEDGLDRLLAEPMNPSMKGVERPPTTVGSGALGYYIIYQWSRSFIPASQARGSLYVAPTPFTPSVCMQVIGLSRTTGGPSTRGDKVLENFAGDRYCAPFLSNDTDEWAIHPRNSASTHENRQRWPLPKSVDSLESSKGGKPGYTESRLTPEEEGVSSVPEETIRPPEVANRTACQSDPLAAGTGHELNEKPVTLHGSNGDEASSCQRRRIKVGFLSAFFLHHSVGLLVEGVVTRLDRQRFETTAIFLQPHPKSTSTASEGQSLGDGEHTDVGDATIGDDVYSAVRLRTEHVLDVPLNSPAACRHAIASLQLDVLVFTEIGMNLESYFLAFSRLARRSAVFWGHAVTSGISAFDDLSSQYDGDYDGPRYRTGTAAKDGTVSVDSEETGRVLTRSTGPQEAGGIDYFVSSWLFENKDLGRRSQRKYSERLYLMKGLTSRFSRPASPKPGLVTRESLGIPHRYIHHDAEGTPNGAVATAPGDDAFPKSNETERATLEGELKTVSSCGALYLVPQTLYKLHPDFDHLVAGILSLDRSGCVIFIRGFEDSMTNQLVQRMSTVLLEADVGSERIIFVPRVGFSKFQGLAELADVVLDPFPVGGGRSSLEVFAVGTPIVMLYNRTSILQLTYGMYATMGLEGNVGNLSGSSDQVPLVTYSEDEFVSSAVAIATDTELNSRVRELILANNHRLYEQDDVVAEWETFLEGIISVPRPSPTERRGELAVDASDFPRSIPWCMGTVRDIGRISTRQSQVDDKDEDHDSSRPYPKSVSTPLLTGYGDAQVARSSPEQTRQQQHSMASGRHTEMVKDVSNLPLLAEETGKQRDDSHDARLVEWPVPRQGAGDRTVGARSDPDDHKVAVTAGREGTEDQRGEKTAELKHSPDVRHETGGLRVAGIGGDLVKGEPDLLYAIQFSIAPPHEGGTPVHLMSKVYDGRDPMEEADRLKREGTLDHLQHRWVGTVLCRGAGRLKRPVVWSTSVKIDDGPRLPLEVREGDDLYQVARWHCLRYSLGAERVPQLAMRLEKEIPQHGGEKWISSRSEDRLCAIPAIASSSPSYSTAYQGENHPTSLESTIREPQKLPKTIPTAAPIPPSSETPATPLRGRQTDTGGRGDDDEGNRVSDMNRKNRDHEEHNGCVTLAITTCKRLRAFLGTVQGLQALLGPLPQDVADERFAPRVCHVLVVDDGSSPKDRGIMISSFPRFTYVFKGSGDVKGHAGSMNLILALTKTPYLLYVEDDWWAIQDKPLPPRSGEGNFLWRAMEVLRRSTERVAQVLINDQSTRNCAWGDTVTCPPEVQGTLSGWPRSTVSPLGQGCYQEASARTFRKMEESADNPSVDNIRHPNDEGRFISNELLGSKETPRSSDTEKPWSNDGIDSGDSPCTSDPARYGNAVEYRFHEFGLVSPLQDLSHWPGFSLNPAVWDLELLRTSYQRHHGRHFEFGSDVRFEQIISVELMDAGVRVAYLPDVTFRHVGAGQSAYEANGMRRPWD